MLTGRHGLSSAVLSHEQVTGTGFVKTLDWGRDGFWVIQTITFIVYLFRKVSRIFGLDFRVRICLCESDAADLKEGWARAVRQAMEAGLHTDETSPSAHLLLGSPCPNGSVAQELGTHSLDASSWCAQFHLTLSQPQKSLSLLSFYRRGNWSLEEVNNCGDKGNTLTRWQGQEENRESPLPNACGILWS